MSSDFKYYEHASQFLSLLPKGAFLTVRAEDKINTMTIGWGAIGYMWRKPVLMVAVRLSRYTYELMEKSGDFSVSVPLDGKHKKSLAEAGSQSGRDIDKFREFSIKAVDGKAIESPVIEGCDQVYECKIIYKQTMDPENLDQDIKEKFYSNGDYHVLYFGEIMSSYSG